jgi:hypothetical protein
MCTEPIMRIFPFSAVRPEKSAAARVAAVPYDVVTTREAEDIIGRTSASSGSAGWMLIIPAFLRSMLMPEAV